MNYAGKFDAQLPIDGSSLHSSGHGHVETVHASHAPADAIVVPDAHLLFNGDFKRSGVDLILSKDGQELVLHEYFKGEKRATLASPDGAHLTGELVNALSGHVQYAQADGSASVSHVIGHVSKLAGTATALRNGVAITLNNGDNVEKGDVVQTAVNSTLGITFIDGTVFGLSSNSRMVLNEMVYDPNGSNNSSLLSLVAGTISFVAGETAKHGDMKVDTPVATMGIRGTAVLYQAEFLIPLPDLANGEVLDPALFPLPVSKFQVLIEPDGTIGSFIIYDKRTLTNFAEVKKAGEQINISNGLVSQTSEPLSPEVQKLIQDVFSLKYTDINTKTTVVQNDSIVPKDGTFGFHLTDGTLPFFALGANNSSTNNNKDNTPTLFFIPAVVPDQTTAQQDRTIHTTGVATSYAWQVSSDNGKDFTTVSTGSSYTPTEADEGKLLQLVVTDTLGTQTFSFGVVQETPDLVVTLDHTTAQQDVAIHVTNVADGGTVVTTGVTYNWEVSDGHGGFTTRSTSASYTPTEADEGKTLQLVVTYADATGNESTTTNFGTVQPIAEPPTLTIASHAVSISENTATALGISVSANDVDDVLSITISGVPSDATLTFVGADHLVHTLTPVGGVYTLTVDQLNSLTLNAGEQTGPVTLSVTVTNTETGETASVSDSISLTVNPVQENPIFSGSTATSASEEGAVVTLGATVATHDSDDGAISVTITGLANDLKGFNGGTYTAATGTWTGTAAQFNALTFQTGEDGTQHLTITATTGGAEAGSTTESFTLTVNPITENPIFSGSISTSASEEGAVVTLGATVATHDADDGAISVTITGLAGDLSNFNGGTYTAATGTWTGTAAQFNALTFQTGEDGTQHLTITATTGGAEAGSTTESYTLTVNPVAEAASLAGTVTAVSGNGETAIALTVVATPFDSDDSLSINISGIPAGATLNHGTLNSDGSYTLTVADLSGLQLNAGETSGDLHVVVTSSEGGVSTTSSVDIAVTVNSLLDITGTLHINGDILQFNTVIVEPTGTLIGFGTVEGLNGTVANITDNGLIEASSSHFLDLNANITGSGTIELTNNTSIEIGGSVASTVGILFAVGTGSVGDLILDDSAEFHAPITGFGGNDIIDLKNIAYSGGATATVLDATHSSVTLGTGASAETISVSIGTTDTIITVTEGTLAATITLEGDYTGHSFTFSSDGSSGGTQFIDPLAIYSGATLELPGASTDNVLFVNNAGITGTLVLDNAAAFSGQISGFAGSGTQTDAIDLKDVTFDSETTWTYTANSAGTGGALTLREGATVVDTVNLAGSYSTASFAVQSDGNGGTLITTPPASSPVPVVMSDPGPVASSSTIVATAPNQTLTGLAASDTFVFNFAAVGNTTVTDFHPATDALQFSSSIFSSALAALNAAMDDGHGNTVIAIDAHDTITLSGTLKAQLSAADFHVT